MAINMAITMAITMAMAINGIKVIKVIHHICNYQQ